MKKYAVKIWGIKKFSEIHWFFTFAFESKGKSKRYLRQIAYQTFEELAGILRHNSKNINLIVEPDILKE